MEIVISGFILLHSCLHPLRLTDKSLHHKLVLKVKNLVAVKSLSLLDTCEKEENGVVNVCVRAQYDTLSACTRIYILQNIYRVKKQYSS